MYRSAVLLVAMVIAGFILYAKTGSHIWFVAGSVIHVFFTLRATRDWVDVEEKQIREVETQIRYAHLILLIFLIGYLGLLSFVPKEQLLHDGIVATVGIVLIGSSVLSYIHVSHYLYNKGIAVNKNLRVLAFFLRLLQVIHLVFIYAVLVIVSLRVT
jgi:hypothetical protein